MSFAGIILLVMVLLVTGALTGATGRRTGIIAGIAGFGLVALLVLCGVIYLWRGVAIPHQAPPTAVTWSGPHAAMSVSYQDGMLPNVAHAKWRISFFPLLLLAGAVATMFLFTMFRRTGAATCAVGTHRTWWPAALLLLFVPLVFFFFVSRTSFERQASVTTHFDAQMHAQQIHEHVAIQQAELERQQQELAQRTGELNSELQHRIENMEIHKLMDLVDAPRIILPIPTPATIAQWAQIATAEQQPGEAVSGEAASAGIIQEAVPPEAEVQAEAEAAVQVIAAEGAAASAAGNTGGVAATAGNSAVSAVAISDTDNGRGQTASLSVEPARSASPAGSKESRPAWVERAPKRVGNVRRDVVITDEYASSEECEWAADRLLQLKTYEHLQRLVGKPLDADHLHIWRNEALSIEGHAPWFIHELEEAGITIDYIHHEIARDEYLEEVERLVGPMLKLYTQIEFTPSVENDLRQRWQISQRQERFAFVGLGASSVLGLLGLAWGLLKIDTWTKGYYTKRLFIGVPLGMLGLLGLLVLFMEKIGGH